MGKIRLKDLARTMKVPEQDLMFKLRSIGVRLEGDDPAIDSEIIQAILQGKRLPQPREVILRDDSQGEGGIGRGGKPSTSLRPQRRSMIQRVEPKIRELEPTRKRGADGELRDDEAMLEATAEAVAEAVEPAIVEAAETASEPAAEPAAPAATAAPQPAVTEAPESPPPAKAEAKAKADQPAARATEEKAAKAPAKKAAEAKKPAAAKAAADAKKKPAKPEAKKPAKAADAKTPKKPADAPKKPERKSRQEFRARLVSKGTGRVPDLAEMTRRRRKAASARNRPVEQPVRREPASARGQRRAQRRQQAQAAGTFQQEGLKFKDGKPETITLAEGMTVREFAEKMGVKSKDLIKTLFSYGVMATINHTLDLETAKKLAEDHGVEVMEVSFEEEVQLQHESVLDDDSVEKLPRAPVVTVMGHVDHGKTTLLDSIRETDVAAGEAGGITQHIGAYHVDLDSRRIVFLDTPGHEAFTMMRARGAKVTDIVILVVAADDGVMPQTIEAIDHAKAAEVPIIVAINKVDKPNANLDRVRKELADNHLLLEDWGGDTVSVEVSALKRQGIDDLLEMVLLTADLLELKAAPSLPARGVIIEARKEVGRGIVATVVLQDGTLDKGDVFVAGATWGRVRTMTDDRGDRLKAAGPATAVEVTGFDDLPSAGDLLQVHSDEGRVRELADFRAEEERQRELAPRAGRMSLENLFDQMGKEEVKELPVVVKADVHGSIEVLRETLEKLSTEKVELKVIHAAVGAISTNDVLLASASNAIIVGFNVRPERNATQLAESEDVDIRLHTVIYELIDEVKAAMTGLLEPTFREVQRGVAEVRETFKVPKIGVIAGSHVTEGVIPRSAGVRLLRDNVVVYEGKIASLRRFKDDVGEVRTGFDCGIGLENFQDLKPGDLIEAYEREEVQPEL
ncbi:MAG: translation initiation factor IF-2 [Acidobacteriota bacterium]